MIASYLVIGYFGPGMALGAVAVAIMVCLAGIATITLALFTVLAKWFAAARRKTLLLLAQRGYKKRMRKSSESGKSNRM